MIQPKSIFDANDSIPIQVMLDESEMFLKLKID